MSRSVFVSAVFCNNTNMYRRVRWLLTLATCLILMIPLAVSAEESYQPALFTPDSSGGIPLSITRFIDLVINRNQQLQSQQADQIIKMEGVKAARAIFEPALVGSYSHQFNREQNSTTDFFSRGGTETYQQEADKYALEVEGLVHTGAQYKVGVAWSETEDSINESVEEYRPLAYVNLTQPLLKNAGIKTTTTQIRIAQADTDLALQSYRQELLNVVGRATVIYWDLYLAQKKVAMRTESVQVANRILEDNRARYRTGKMAEIEVLEAEAGLALRKALEVEARKTYVAAMNDVLTLFAEHAVGYDADIIAIDPLVLESGTYSYQDSIGRAFKLRPEYLATHTKLSQEDIRLAYAKNQRWPELDLKASLGLNGLDNDQSDAWANLESKDYYSWSVGVEFRIPLFGDQKSSSEMAQVKQRKRKVLLEMKAIEVALANAVETTIYSIQSATEQARYSSSVAEFNSRLLEIELVRLKAGKSNSRMVLEKEEDFRSAREAELEALVNQKKAILELEMAEGSLLSRYHKDVLEEGV
ncbi:MAG: TolC family protein [Desulfuromonas sp.]|nr:TolC family protein [Desulfuromonas sp.]